MLIALYLLSALGLMGAFDTLYYHEYQQQLPRNATAKVELRLHATRDFAYTIVFGSLAWTLWLGAWAWLFLAILACEICITLWDFIEEDISRRLPPGERAMHTIMAITYGGFLANIIPEIIGWSSRTSGIAAASHGSLSWLLSAFAIGVFLSGIRDVVASFRMERANL